MSKKIIKTKHAPAAIGPYSQAVCSESLIFTSGQIAIDPNTNEFISAEIGQETEQTIKNIIAILEADGLNLDNVVKTTVYLVDLKNFNQMNKVYETFFNKNKPARACVEVSALPKGAKVEIDAIATRLS